MAAHISPRLLDESELKRLRVCADENTTLANCWNKGHVALVAMEWAPVGFSCVWNGYVARNQQMGHWRPQDQMPVLSVEIIPPTTLGEAKARSDSEDAPSKPRRYTFWVRSQMALWGSARQSKLPVEPDTRVFYEPAAIVTKTLNKIFTELGQGHTICVCSHRPGQTQKALAEIGFSLPKKAVFVDLIKVLEYQSKFRPLTPELQKYVQSRLHVDSRNGGEFIEKFESADGSETIVDWYTTAPRWGRDREWVEVIRRPDDISAADLVRELGPQAEVYRREIDRVEKENTAVERASKGLGKDEAKDLRRVVKKELQKRKS